MGLGVARGASQYVALYGLLTLVLLTTTLAFLPIGQMCGRLLDRLPRLEAYGWNLAGSLAGVGLMFWRALSGCHRSSGSRWPRSH